MNEIPWCCDVYITRRHVLLLLYHTPPPDNKAIPYDRRYIDDPASRVLFVGVAKRETSMHDISDGRIAVVMWHTAAVSADGTPKPNQK